MWVAAETVRLSGAQAACPAALDWLWDALEGALCDSNCLSLTIVYRHRPFPPLILPVAASRREPPELAREGRAKAFWLKGERTGVRRSSQL